MTKISDNKMGWVRNLEELKISNTSGYFVEYELASDSYIPGLLDYNNGKILCSPMTFERGITGLYKYLLKVEFAHIDDPTFNQNANKKGYLFKEGIPGELTALLSLYFQCRFYLLAAYYLTSQGSKVKSEYEIVFRPCGPNFNPAYFPGSDRNFAVGLSDFLNLVICIDVKYHQQLILACYHYAKALKEFGIDEEMVFIRLVSAIEALSQWAKLKNSDDLFDGRQFSEVVKTDLLFIDEQNELENIFETRKSKIRYKRFIEQYSKGFFKGGNFKAPHTKIKKANLPKTLDAIYDSRSHYLHKGKPMYLSLPMRGGQKWDTDPSLEMIIDNRKFSKKEKLPYGDFFQRLVRHCLMQFIVDVPKKSKAISPINP